MKTSASIVTPSHTNVWLEILQFFPTVAFFCISTNAPIFVLSPISQPYRLMNLESFTPLPNFTFGAISQYSLTMTPTVSFSSLKFCVFSRLSTARNSGESHLSGQATAINLREHSGSSHADITSIVHSLTKPNRAFASACLILQSAHQIFDVGSSFCTGMKSHNSMIMKAIMRSVYP